MYSFSKRSRLIQTAITIRSHAQIKNKILAGLLISIATLYAPMLNAAPIYKVIDENTGQVTFTDRPKNYEQQTDKQISQTNITTGNNTSSYSGSANLHSNTDNESNTPVTSTAKALQVNYQLTMTEPSEERAYRRPAQSIVVNLQLKPALQVGDNVSITLDGNEVSQGLSASISTVDILPGSHVVNAVVKNEKGQTLKQISRTIYIIQNTQTLQNNKKIAQQLLAYQQLPWHQKVLLKLRQDNKQPNMESFNKPQADKPMTLEQPAKK